MDRRILVLMGLDTLVRNVGASGMLQLTTSNFDDLVHKSGKHAFVYYGASW
jgi:hypothetical protein